MNPHASLRYRRRFPRLSRPALASRALSRAGFRTEVLVVLLVAALAVVSPLRAQEAPERQREVGAPQPVGVVHTVRQIPEACTRIEGAFTGEAAEPYRSAIVPTGGSCQPRARFVDAAQARPAAAAGWILNDVIRVPDAACPSRQAVTRIWRKPGAEAPARDGQGQSRVYLEDATRQGAQGAALPQFSAVLSLEGKSCR